jgi:hypothetical protein
MNFAEERSVLILSGLLAQKQEWLKWAKEIPFIQWPAHWKVKAVPPSNGAIIRYYVLLPNKKQHISIYLDCYEHLGFFGQPYWEVYPVNNDVARCAMNDTEELLKLIASAGEKE